MSNPIAEDLRRTVDAAFAKLSTLSAEASARRPAPDKWSAREIIGHLVDSACNNHARFVRAQLEDDLIFPGYQQEEWVRIQAYQESAWGPLLDLWRAYNLHLAGVIDATGPDVARRPRHRHNLDRLAWRPVPQDQPATLEYFMQDYVEHLKHHLRQIAQIHERN